MAFMLQDVIEELERSHSLEQIKKLKKKNLVEVAVNFGITPAVGATKSHILDLIENYCIDNNIIDEVEEKPTAETAEVLQSKLEFEREERRLAREEAREEAQKAHDAEKALRDAQLAAQREETQRAHEAAEAEAQKARELRLAELKEARELHELELKAEQEKAFLEAEKEAAVCEHELKEDRRIDAIASKRKLLLVTCTRLEENSPSKEEL